MHSFDFWAVLMLQYTHLLLSPNALGTSAWTTLKIREENYFSYFKSRTVDMLMKKKNIADMQNSSCSSFYVRQDGRYGTLTVLL